MRLSLLVFVLVFSCYTRAAEEVDVCELYFDKEDFCTYKGITVKLLTTRISFDEKILNSLVVINQGNKHSLSITKDTFMLEGDKGYIFFQDINFDGYPDIAITTSFGLVNIFLDYWVYSTKNKQYVFVGNFSKLKLNNELKLLSNRIKINAAEYKNNTYTWQGLKLVMK